jgi:hypothetical protein
VLFDDVGGFGVAWVSLSIDLTEFETCRDPRRLNA